jgi:hypothetical protein
MGNLKMRFSSKKLLKKEKEIIGGIVAKTYPK